MSYMQTNVELAKKLNLLINLMHLHGVSIWKIKTYEKALHIVRNLNVDSSSIKDFSIYDGIGKGTSKVIKEILQTGSCSYIDELSKEYPNLEDALKLTSVRGVGIKTAVNLYRAGIKTVQELSDACDSGVVTNKQIVGGVKLALKSSGRLPITKVLPVLEPLLNRIRNLPEVERAEFCGSIRRGMDTVKDADVIVLSNDREKTSKFFLSLGEPIVDGTDKLRVIIPVDLMNSIQFDLLFADKRSFGSSILYFTGSKEHNISMRQRALEIGLTLNEHGFCERNGGPRFGGETEEGVYKRLSIPYHPPELREGYDLKSSIPNLIKRSHIISDWHMHTTYSADAKDSILDMSIAAKKFGLTTIGFTDHVEENYGWMPCDVDKRIDEIRMAEETVGIKIYAAAEVGVTKDGNLIDRIPLDRQDYIIASIHRMHDFNPTKRLIKAVKHPKVKILGHPTGRIVGVRDIPDCDWRELFKVCYNEGVLIEINGARMDPPEHIIAIAKHEGCKFVINSDAHSASQLNFSNYALMIARRAGLTIEDISTPMKVHSVAAKC